MGGWNAFFSVAASTWLLVGGLSANPPVKDDQTSQIVLQKLPETSPSAPAPLFNSQHSVQRYVPGERLVEQAIGHLFWKNFLSVAHDEKLSSAARLLAEAILAQPDNEALKTPSGDLVQEAVFQAGGYDPMPSAIYLRGGPPQALAEALANHPALDDRSANRFGVAILSRSDEKNAGVVILTHRRVQLSSIPNNVAVRQQVTLEGQLSGSLSKPEIAVTGPDGIVSRIHMEERGMGYFSQGFSLMKPGRSVVEVLAEGRHGLEVVAMFPVFASKNGEPSGNNRHDFVQSLTKQAPSPTQLPSGATGMTPVKGTGTQAATQVLKAINALRMAHGLAPVVRWKKLDDLAVNHAEDMVQSAFFGHKSPEHGDLGARLLAAGIQYTTGAENIGEANSALAAHQTIEASPGHRSNLLLPELTHVGIGVVSSKLHPQNVYVVEIFIRTRQQ